MPTPAARRRRRTLALFEAPRFLASSGSLIASYPWLASVPRSRALSIMVLPGFGASDFSTAPLRAFLRSQGHRVYGWGLGTNLGYGRLGGLEPLIDRLEELSDRRGEPLALVGHSLGGAFARRLAQTRPDLVTKVISLGSPISGSPSGSPLWPMYRRLNPGAALRVVNSRFETERPLPVPATSIYSKTDAIVHWQRSLEIPGPRSESIEIIAGHMELLVSPPAFYAVADRLAQAESEWMPFEVPRGLPSVFFPA